MYLIFNEVFFCWTLDTFRNGCHLAAPFPKLTLVQSRFCFPLYFLVLLLLVTPTSGSEDYVEIHPVEIKQQICASRRYRWLSEKECYSLPAASISHAATPLSAPLSVFNLSQKLFGLPLARDDFEASTVEKFRHSRYASMAGWLGPTRSLHDGAAQKAAAQRRRLRIAGRSDR